MRNAIDTLGNVLCKSTMYINMARDLEVLHPLVLAKCKLNEVNHLISEFVSAYKYKSDG